MSEPSQPQFIVSGPVPGLQRAVAELRAMPGVNGVREHRDPDGGLEFLTVALVPRATAPQVEQFMAEFQRRFGAAGLAVEADQPLRPL